MASLHEAIELRCSVKRVSFDDEGEALLTLRIPAADAVKAARFAVMRGIVFAAKFTPEAAEPGDSV